MSRSSIPLIGPLSIHSFGLMVALGLSLFVLLMLKSKRRQALMSATLLHDTILVGIIAALIGGRFLALAGSDELWDAHFTDWLSLWDGGLSSLGSVLGVVFGWTLYLHAKKIPVLPFFDVAAIYVPLVHVFVRLGCFFAGCCYGSPTTQAWGVVYQENDLLAPVGVALHPTQLYSVIALLGIFVFLYYLSQKSTPPGTLFGWYLVLTNAERFMVDFFRGDREYIASSLMEHLSLHQWIALGLMIVGIGILVWSKRASIITPKAS